MFPYSAMVEYFSKEYLQKVQPNQPVLLDTLGRKELDLLVYEAGFMEKRDSLPKIHCREKQGLYELLVETNIFNPEWRQAGRPSEKEENAGAGLEDTVHGSTRHPCEYSYLSFSSENDQNLFLEHYNFLNHLKYQELIIAGTELVNVKRNDLKKLFKILAVATAMSEVVPIMGAVKDGISLASAGLALGIAATTAGIYYLGNYVSNSRIKTAEKKVEIVHTNIEALKSEIEKYRPRTLFNKEALEAALEIK